MMQTDIKFVVVGHHSRRHQAEQLADLLNAHLLIDEGQHGANWNHRRAIEWASQQDCRVVILEDDALLVNGFTEKVTAWLSRFPDELISFYLGTGRPPQYQLEIAIKLIDADRRQADYITINRLVHGVCYSVPLHKLQQVISRWNHRSPADYAVGDACGGSVIYPCYSLVDHLDSNTVERHPDNTPRTERRRAWRLDLKEHHGTTDNA
ncbi:hypothetical protein [Pantoea sp. CFSAN033090]|uniref:hypothetical protein n=1 Tax=Pantoea sp. CFSAN033090 TaxID=1690502 RepID=UPI00068F6CB8|nr:hypothetical protein [Pantoea sp. CFSAN033090]KOA70453.1 hypothetical protein AFL22_11090 [Pantoea sp. CFSAN033090]